VLLSLSIFARISDNMNYSEASDSSIPVKRRREGTTIELPQQEPSVSVSLPPSAPTQLPLSIRRPHFGLPTSPTQVEAFPASSFLNDYILEPTVLGRGSFSVVRACTQRATGEKRAAKIIDLRKLRLSHAFKASALLEEVRILRALDHEGVIKVCEVYEGPLQFPTTIGQESQGNTVDAVIIVTELAPGGELFDSIIKAGNFTEVQARYVIAQLLNALVHLHSRGVVHRDLKPENILVFGSVLVPASDPVVRPGQVVTSLSSGPFRGSGVNSSSSSSMLPMPQVKIADFGVARYVGVHPQQHGAGASTFVGSPQYVAPEVLLSRGSGGGGSNASSSSAARHSYGCAVDVYSLGVVLYVMLAGYLPFDDGAPVPPELHGAPSSYPTWEARAIAGVFHFAPPVWTHTSEAVKSLIRGMMAPDPSQRLTSEQALSHPWFDPLLRSHDQIPDISSLSINTDNTSKQLSMQRLLIENPSLSVAPLSNAVTAATIPSAISSAKGINTSSALEQAMEQSSSDVRVLQTVAQSIDFKRLLSMQQQLASAFRTSYTHVLSTASMHPGAPAEVRRLAVAARDLQFKVKNTVSECRDLSRSIQALIPELTISVQDKDVGLTRGIFIQLRKWVGDLKTQSQSIQGAYSALIVDVHMSLERAVGQMVASNAASSITDGRRPPISPSSSSSALRASPPPPPPSSSSSSSQMNDDVNMNGHSTTSASTFLRSASVDSTSTPISLLGESTTQSLRNDGLIAKPNVYKPDSIKNHSNSASETEDMFLELFLDTSTVVSDERKLVTMLTSIGFDVASTSGTLDECAVSFPTKNESSSPHRAMSSSTISSPTSSLSSSSLPSRTPLMTSPNSNSLESQVSSIVETTPFKPETTNPLLYILEDLQMVDSTLLEFVSFWQAYELVLGMLLRREEHTETLLTYATSSRSINKALSSLDDYARFWKAFTFLCGQYVSAIDSRTVEMYAWLVGRQSHLGQLITNN
jgi:serine/threonine protein kinase